MCVRVLRSLQRVHVMRLMRVMREIFSCDDLKTLLWSRNLFGEIFFGASKYPKLFLQLISFCGNC